MLCASWVVRGAPKILILHIVYRLLRVMLGGMLLYHGIHRITHGIAPIKKMFVMYHLPEMLAYGVYVGEVLAPIL